VVAEVAGLHACSQGYQVEAGGGGDGEAGSPLPTCSGAASLTEEPQTVTEYYSSGPKRVYAGITHVFIRWGSVRRLRLMRSLEPRVSVSLLHYVVLFSVFPAEPPTLWSRPPISRDWSILGLGDTELS
jgi:hypothetical protein